MGMGSHQAPGGTRGTQSNLPYQISESPENVRRTGRCPIQPSLLEFIIFLARGSEEEYSSSFPSRRPRQWTPQISNLRKCPFRLRHPRQSWVHEICFKLCSKRPRMISKMVEEYEKVENKNGLSQLFVQRLAFRLRHPTKIALGRVLDTIWSLPHHPLCLF